MASKVLQVTIMVLLLAGSAYGSAAGGHGHGSGDPVIESNDPMRGIALGEFTMRDFSPVEGTKVRIHFTLFAGVKREHAVEFEKLLHANEARVRDHVLTAVRLVPLPAYDEPDLKTFRRRIVLRLRRAMPELQIEKLYLTDFNFLSK